MENSCEHVFKNNQAWAQKQLELDPEYFANLARTQQPEFLWIGCSDSRVHPNEITGMQPGDIFVHRNIANLVIHTDMNLLSVLQYSVEVLKVKHVVVCGHYECGGIKAAMSRNQYGLIDNWLRNIKDVHRLHWEELENIQGEQAKLNRMAELNVIEQVRNIRKTSVIQNAWKQNSAFPKLHGWIFDIHTGLIKDLSVENYGYAELTPAHTYI